MMMGEVKGNIESQKASGVLGSRMMAMAQTMQRTSGRVTGNCNCCASSSLLHMAPMAA